MRPPLVTFPAIVAQGAVSWFRVSWFQVPGSGSGFTVQVARSEPGAVSRTREPRTELGTRTRNVEPWNPEPKPEGPAVRGRAAPGRPARAGYAGCCTTPCARLSASRTRRRCAPAGAVRYYAKRASSKRTWVLPYQLLPQTEKGVRRFAESTENDGLGEI